MTLYEFLKSIILILVFASITPFLIKNIRSQYGHLLEPCTYIGVLSLKGPLSDSSPYIKHLHSFFKDPLIKGIILKIDCFECAAGTSQTIFNEIQQFKKEYPKPVISLIENVAVCGGYLVATASDYIIAPESAIVGGIGTYAHPEQLADFFNLFAVNYPIKKELSKQSNNQASPIYNETYQQFTKHVANARRLSLATISNWANEKIFTGKQAYSLGLINAIGSMHTVITILKEKALIDGEIEWVEKECTKSRPVQFHPLKALYNIVMNENPKEA